MFVRCLFQYEDGENWKCGIKKRQAKDRDAQNPMNTRVNSKRRRSSFDCGLLFLRAAANQILSLLHLPLLSLLALLAVLYATRLGLVSATGNNDPFKIQHRNEEKTIGKKDNWEKRQLSLRKLLGSDVLRLLLVNKLHQDTLVAENVTLDLKVQVVVAGKDRKWQKKLTGIRPKEGEHLLKNKWIQYNQSIKQPWRCADGRWVQFLLKEIFYNDFEQKTMWTLILDWIMKRKCRRRTSQARKKSQNPGCVSFHSINQSTILTGACQSSSARGTSSASSSGHAYGGSRSPSRAYGHWPYPFACRCPYDGPCAAPRHSCGPEHGSGTATGFLIIRPSLTSRRMFCPTQNPHTFMKNPSQSAINTDLRELELVISVISLGSSQTLLMPQERTDAARRFCRRRVLWRERSKVSSLSLKESSHHKNLPHFQQWTGSWGGKRDENDAKNLLEFATARFFDCDVRQRARPFLPCALSGSLAFVAVVANRPVRMQNDSSAVYSWKILVFFLVFRHDFFVFSPRFTANKIMKLFSLNCFTLAQQIFTQKLLIMPVFDWNAPPLP